MDPQPAASPLSAAVGYADSVESSPRSRNTDSWDEPAPSAKLRLMCSYGGHIVPRPHDKSLCYVGGDTRIVVSDRHVTLSELSIRLSKTLLNGRPFTLKYQLPNEDLDSLISVTTDEDLENMIEEYDRISNSPLKPSRIRLFLFAVNDSPSSSTIGSILDNSAKSEDWFLNALNGSNFLPRGISADSASVNCLLNLDDDVAGGGTVGGRIGSNSGEGHAEANVSDNKLVNKQGQDVHSVPDSPMLDTTSSFGSTSSSPLLANLPPIRLRPEDGGGGGGVRLQDQKIGFEEQFAQMSVGGPKQEENFVPLSSPPNMAAAQVVSGIPLSAMAVPGEYTNRVIADDERSEQHVALGYQKVPQQPLLPAQSQPKPGGGLELASPDSVSSDNSVANAISRQKPMVYQDPLVQIPSSVTNNPKLNISDPNPSIQMQQQLQNFGYLLPSQFDQQQQQPSAPPPQQQFIHATPQFIHHHPAGGVPLSSYYPIYPSHPQQQPHHHHHPQLDQQQYPPVYFVRQTQGYNLPVQNPNYTDPTTTTTVPQSRPQTPPNPSKQHEMAAGMYRAPAAPPAPSQLLQVPSSNQQYVGFPQIHHHPSQSAAANYGYEYADPAHGQIYYTQPIAPNMASQYQTMTSAGQVVVPESSVLPTESIKQQQVRTSQPL